MCTVLDRHEVNDQEIVGTWSGDKKKGTGLVRLTANGSSHCLCRGGRPLLVLEDGTFQGLNLQHLEIALELMSYVRRRGSRLGSAQSGMAFPRRASRARL